jgi:hypothetical protein
MKKVRNRNENAPKSFYQIKAPKFDKLHKKLQSKFKSISLEFISIIVDRVLSHVKPVTIAELQGVFQDPIKQSKFLSSFNILIKGVVGKRTSLSAEPSPNEIKQIKLYPLIEDRRALEIMAFCLVENKALLYIPEINDYIIFSDLDVMDLLYKAVLNV